MFHVTPKEIQGGKPSIIKKTREAGTPFSNAAKLCTSKYYIYWEVTVTKQKLI